MSHLTQLARMLRLGVLLVLLLQSAPFRVTSRAAECGEEPSHCCASSSGSHSLKTRPSSGDFVLEHEACGGCCGRHLARRALGDFGDGEDGEDDGGYAKAFWQGDSFIQSGATCDCSRGEPAPVDEPVALPVSAPIRAVAPQVFWENWSRISPALCHWARGRHAAGEERILAQWRETVGAVSPAGWGRRGSVEVLLCSLLV